MSARNLTQVRIDALTPRKTVRNIRDRALKGFGIRVLPSGAKRFFIHTQRNGQRIWKIIGDAETVSLDEARRLSRDLIGSIRADEVAPSSLQDTLFEAVAEEVFRNYGRNWKPGTMKVNRGYLRNQILPWFAGRQITDITRSDVRQWSASLHATPVAADRSTPILSAILRQAEVYGYRQEGSNPCLGMRRYRTKGRERFLSGEELRRLARTLDRHESSRPLHVAFVRLLLLTGCRKGELATLEWSSYREGHLFLPDGKTGPRTVWLSSPARAVIEQLPRTGRWVFPAHRARKPLCTGAFDAFWWRIRAEADVRDVRLHDLRHSYASIAIMQGESVATTGRLLGHSSSVTTLKYAHLSDSSVREAVDVLGAVLAEG